MNISLPESLKTFVEEQVHQRGFGNSSEFVRDLIRREQARAQMNALLVEGLESGPGSVADADYFERLRKQTRHVADDSRQ